MNKTEMYSGIWPWAEAYCISNDVYDKMSEEQVTGIETNLYWAIVFRECPNLIANCTALPYLIEGEDVGKENGFIVVENISRV